jgi:hypothetical protein
MANQKVGSNPDWTIRATGTTDGWQEGSQPNRSDMGKARETRAELEGSGHPFMTKEGNG